MQDAGHGAACLLRALAPHARRVWVAAGPGNNGGDGLVLARLLHDAGLAVQVTLLAEPQALHGDALDAYDKARRSGVAVAGGLPDAVDCDIAVDALLGLGASRAPAGVLAEAIRRLNAGAAPVLAIDLPSGLCADSGRLLGESAVRASDTLSLLTLKPGLFTAQGRDHSGRIWFDALGVDASAQPPTARLLGPAPASTRRHAQHKGSFGDVIVVGGAAGMGGAAMLAARAALFAGAGRVLVVRLDGCVDTDPVRPELMPRTADETLLPVVLARSTVVCGCGGGESVRRSLPVVLHHAARLVLDADALNAIANEAALRSALRTRGARGLPTIITPHPLEAARLLGTDSACVQVDRLAHADTLAVELRCTAVLKGSGTVVATSGHTPAVNPTGNARLGTAGSGDVLAGWMGGLWAQHAASPPHDIACTAVWRHGRAAESGDNSCALCAADLIASMAGLPSTG